ncbi:hypothetical protein ACMA5I_10205 [Paracoccaceae bacterium GXU_MW_L88]
MTLQKGTRYIRTAPDNEQTIAVISNDKDLAYHQDLAEKGYTYKEVVVNAAPDSTCVSCEG